MNSRILKLCLVAAFSFAAVAAFAENPFAGTWKLDASKSKLTGNTITFAPADAGTISVTSEGMTYTFKPDGSETKTPFGEMAQWTKVDDNTWQAVYKKGSTTLDTDVWKLGADGKTLSVNSTGTKPNGDQFNEDEAYTRLTAGKGFFGKWKSTKVSANSPNTAEIAANGDDGIIWNIPEIKASVTLKFDGKDVKPVGPTVPDGLTLAATKAGARSFKLEEKINGKLIWSAHYTVSADGKTLTEIGTPVGGTAPETVVYEKS
jgi:hypothetical protein